MPSNTPNVGAPMWDAAQASPWTPHNKAFRIFDALFSGAIVSEVDRTSPPGSCADGAKFLLRDGASGDWAGHQGEIAIAVGTNAANGWYYAEAEVEGFVVYDQESGNSYRYNGTTWVAITDSISRLNDLVDVDDTGLADGYILRWDQSNGIWYPSPDVNSLEHLTFAASDETTAIASSTDKFTFWMPYAFALSEVRAMLTTPQTSGSAFTADVNHNGSSILGTKFVFDNGSNLAGSRALGGHSMSTLATITTANLVDAGKITVDVDAVGDGTAKGLKISLIGRRR